ncbi:hypothetical protein SAMN04515617_10260 [Collimonas sp. OK242]|jgi:hypothetical protein|uniref:hypothetical protein n=1 Tax=Collimonas sp. OK242 TaxID=1798195 RepID=UPI00089D2323|nr:hypothetical protein [Collimonas sp. OK242]SDX21192.1 hypothetical protein SAMN04515617_10260 [Collimonas sp. OK242]
MRISFIVVMLAVCSTFSHAEESAAGKQDDPKSDTARIRLFGQNGMGVKYYPNSACYGGESVTVSGGIGDAFSSFLGTASNTSIGMPETPNSGKPSARNGLFSKAFFREYKIAADQPLTLKLDFQSNPGVRYGYCKTIAGTFVPEAGKDYEISLDIKDGMCVPILNELQSTADGVILQPVPASKAEHCS